jgi:type 1 glutamine amidotransferase
MLPLMFSLRKLIPLLLMPLSCFAQTAPAAPKPNPSAPKHVLVIGEADDFTHDTITDAMAAVYNMGKESGLWEATLRTDIRLLTNNPAGRNVKGLPYFDCIVFASASGDMPLTDEQKKDLLAAIHDKGECFIGIHASLTSFYHWPEFGKMQGGYFDQHPWDTFNAPIRNEQPDFPAVRHFPRQFGKVDEIYQPRDWSRDDVNVLLSLDPSRWNFPPSDRLHRTDKDFAIAWAKMYGKGRVFYSTLGHSHESWQDPDVRTMYFEAIKWGLGMTEGSTASHPAPKP